MTSFRNGSLAAVIFLLTLLTPLLTFAAVGINPQIPFAGILKDSGGNEIDGTRDMTFAIYATSVGGGSLWTESHASVAVADGSFQVMLGSLDSFDDDIDFNDDQYYLGVTIGTDPEMTPRERLGSTGYAINSSFLDGLDSSSFLQTGNGFLIDAASTSALLTINQQDSGDLLSLHAAGAELFTVLNNGALNLQSSDDSFFNGNLKFGDGSGVYLGSIDGGVSLSVNTSNMGPNSLMLGLYGDAIPGESVDIGAEYALTFSANGATSQPFFELATDGTVSLTSIADANALFDVSVLNGMTVSFGNFRVSDGDVKIGTGEPAEALDVDGTIRSQDLAGTGDEMLYADDQGNITRGPMLSDERLKENIQTIDYALDIVLGLRGVRYEWADKNRFGSQTEVGFIAQEIQQEVPEVVRQNGEYFGIKIQNVVAVVVEAIKELNTKVEEYFTRTERLEREVADLREEIKSLKGDTQTEQNDESAVEEVVPEVQEEDVVPQAETAEEVITEENVVE